MLSKADTRDGLVAVSGFEIRSLYNSIIKERPVIAVFNVAGDAVANLKLQFLSVVAASPAMMSAL